MKNDGYGFSSKDRQSRLRNTFQFTRECRKNYPISYYQKLDLILTTKNCKNRDPIPAGEKLACTLHLKCVHFKNLKICTLLNLSSSAYALQITNQCFRSPLEN